VSGCDALLQDAALGVAPALRAVDCVSGSMATGAFARLFGSQGALQPALTLVLTLYIGLFALALLSGRSRLSLAALSPRMLTIGLVLTFATSWLAYQAVVWNLVVGGPDEIARIMTGTRASATQMFADRIDMILSAIDRVAQEAQEQAGASAAPGAAPAAAAAGLSPVTVMWLAALLLLLGTVGVLLTARIALAVLMAVGPVFIVLALFRGSRGLAAGWLRALVLTAVTPLFVVIGGGVTVELVVPVIQRLNGIEGIDMRAAIALFLVAAVHVALMGLMLKVAGTMVAGWRVFGARDERGRDTLPVPAVASPAPVAAFVAPAARVPGMEASGTFTVAEPMATAGGVSRRREVVTHSPMATAPSLLATRRRAHGIGSRFPAHRMLR
jgi:type IV secretion system protein VirB6